MVHNVRMEYSFYLVQQKSPSSSSQLLQPKQQMSAQYPTSKSTTSLHSRRNSYGSRAVTQHSPSSPVPRKTRLLSSTYNPKHSMLTRGGSATELGSRMAGGGSTKQAGQGSGASNATHSHRKPQSNDMSDLVVTSARIVSIMKETCWALL